MVQLLSDDGTCVDDYGEAKNFDECMYSKLYDLNMEVLSMELNCVLSSMNFLHDFVGNELYSSLVVEQEEYLHRSGKK